MTIKRAREIVRRFAGKRIVVVGDLMLDHYLIGEVRRISPEAPVPVVEHHREHFLPGGAANVARNITALGSQARLLGVVGDDMAATQLGHALREGGMKAETLIAEPGRHTTLKTRILAGHQQMIRVDREHLHEMKPGSRRILRRRLAGLAADADAIIVSDYAKGMIDQELIDYTLALGARIQVPVFIDPKPTRRLCMKGCALLAPNRKESFELAGLPDEPVGLRPAEHPGLRRAMEIIHREHAPACLLVTLGEAGMLVHEMGGEPRHLPTVARDVFDVSGAGDTVVATFALARVSGANAVEAAMLANLAAGVVVGKLGTATVSPQELAEWARHSLSTLTMT